MFRLTPMVKNILIINVVVFVLSFIFKGLDISSMMAMYRLDSIYFAPYQVFTYMFAHAGFTHILFNMLGLVFLGVSLEMVWGPKKFLAFYIITGMGAGIFYGALGFFESRSLQSDFNAYKANPSVEAFSMLVGENRRDIQNYYDIVKIYEFITAYEQNPENAKAQSLQLVQEFENTMITQNRGRVIGASGAVYAILMAFGLLFPERQLMLLFPPIPIKAKYLVLILGGMAIYLGLSRNAGDQVAHFAHLGGMLFGFLMVKFF